MPSFKLTESTQYIDSGNSGLKHKTAWAGAGDGVLFFDPDGRNAIAETRNMCLRRDPGAARDLEALRSAFDSSGDGKRTSATFKLVTEADGAAPRLSAGQAPWISLAVPMAASVSAALSMGQVKYRCRMAVQTALAAPPPAVVSRVTSGAPMACMAP